MASFDTLSTDLTSALPHIEAGLPQCGFAPGLASQSRNPVANPWPQHDFLFRVWREDPQVVQLQPALGFVAPLFRSPFTRPETLHTDIRAWRSCQAPSSDDVRDRVLGRATLSPFIPTTLSFFWALSWACRVRESGVREDRSYANPSKIFISIIRACDIGPHAIEMPLRHCGSGTKEYNCANLAQEVFVYGHIPQSAVVATIDLYTLQEPMLMPEWMNFSPDPEDRHDYVKFRSWVEGWVQEFRKRDVSANTHALDMFSLADRLARHECLGSPQIRDVLALAEHLFGWPYRPRDHRNYHQTGSAPDFISSLTTSFESLLPSNVVVRAV